MTFGTFHQRGYWLHEIEDLISSNIFEQVKKTESSEINL